MLSLQIIAIFAVIIFTSFIPDIYHLFFDDWFCIGAKGCGENRIGCHYFEPHDAQWHWGYRHYMWFFMGCCLTIIQAIRVGDYISKNHK